MTLPGADLSGAVMVGLDGPELTSADRNRLAQPAVGGVCLFTRNFVNSQQLSRLVGEARNCVSKPLVFAVDHEGGRVQRFVSGGFTRLKPPRQLGVSYEKDPSAAVSEAYDRGLTISRQLANTGVDLSFVPTLDIDYGRNDMISSRCFSDDVDAVSALALAFCGGLAEHGFAGVGKHFPGHGWASADSHFETPVDNRSLGTIMSSCVKPYEHLMAKGALGAVMVSHVRYSRLSDQPASSSADIIGGVLRGRMGFTGLVVTDDLVMEGAGPGDGITERTIAAHMAGCELFLWVGGEPVLLDKDLARLPAADGGGPSPWQGLRRSRT